MWFIGGPLDGQTTIETFPPALWYLTYTVDAPPAVMVDEDTPLQWDYGLRCHLYRRALTGSFFYYCHDERDL